MLLAKARHDGCDIVIASRYVTGADAHGLAGPARQFGSRGLTWLTRAAFPRRLSGVSDPLSGYFLVQSGVAAGCRLRPIGYKILLEILVRCKWDRAGEVPYSFRPRAGGESKAGLRQLSAFLRHLAALVWDCSPAFAFAHRNVGKD
jgi:dolichol-phosphate mannosyltransferase